MPARYSLTEQDVVSGNDLWRRQQVNIWPLVTVLAFSWLLISAYMARTLTGLSLVLTVLFILILVLLLGAVTLWHGKRQSRRMSAIAFRQATGASREVRVTWNAEKIEFRQHKAYRTQAWSEISRWAESDTTFVLLSADGMYNPIPKRALTSDDLTEIKGHLAAAGAKRARLLFY